MSDIRHQIEISAAPERVRELVARGAGLAQWWAEDVSETSDPACVELGFFNRATVYRLTLQAGPAEGAVWACSTGKEWQGTTIEFHLEAIPTGTRVRFAHAGWQAATDYFVSCNTAWGALLFRLRAAAEGQRPGALFSRTGLAY